LKGKTLADFPSLGKQWHWKKNDKLKPKDFASQSHKEVRWKCNKGIDHEWEGTIKNRVRQKSG